MKKILDIYNIRHNKTYINNLMNTRNVIPFIGAGMSAYIYPQWREFLEQFSLLSSERINLEKLLNNGSYEEAASFLSSISDRLFVDTVKEIFSPSKIIEKPLSIAMKTLPFFAENMVITTNIDELLEYAWKNAGRRFDAVITPDNEDRFNQALSENLRILVKLHGTVSESSKYVLTKEQYDEKYGIDSKNGIDMSKQFPRDLGRAIQAKTFLFLGCSLKNDRVLDILKQIAGENEHIKHYAVLSMSNNGDENILRERSLAEYGIYVIWYPEKAHEYVEIILDELLKQKKK